MDDYTTGRVRTDRVYSSGTARTPRKARGALQGAPTAYARKLSRSGVQLRECALSTPKTGTVRHSSAS